jgi:hypothetical protein
MAARTRLRRIADPVVAAPPPGVRVRTRIHPTEAEAAALTKIGAYLGSVYRGELAGRIRCGVLDRNGRAAWRTARKRALTAVASSRWAGAITRAVEDQYQLGMRGLAAHAADLRAAIDVLARRCALRPGQVAAIDPVEASRRSRTRLGRGYRSAAEPFAKTRRLAALRERSEKVEAALSAGRPTIVVGRKRFWCTRNHLDQAGLSTQQWRQSWDATRMFLTADGESGKPGGNETIRVDGAARLRIKTPAALVDQLGTHVALAASVRFAHRGDEWAARVAARRAVRYDLNYDSKRNRWYLDASWTLTPDPAPGLNELRAGGSWGWISTPTIWPAACWIPRVTRSPHQLISRWPPPGCTRRSETGGCARRLPTCLTMHKTAAAGQSWWRIWISAMPAPPDAKPWAAVDTESGCAAPLPASPPDDSVTG